MQCLEPLDILCHCKFVKTPRELTFGYDFALLTLSLFSCLRCDAYYGYTKEKDIIIRSLSLSLPPSLPPSLPLWMGSRFRAKLNTEPQTDGAHIHAG
jgi:hypothetical protein